MWCWLPATPRNRNQPQPHSQSQVPIPISIPIPRARTRVTASSNAREKKKQHDILSIDLFEFPLITDKGAKKEGRERERQSSSFFRLWQWKYEIDARGEPAQQDAIHAVSLRQHPPLASLATPPAPSSLYLCLSLSLTTWAVAIVIAKPRLCCRRQTMLTVVLLSRVIAISIAMTIADDDGDVDEAVCLSVYLSVCQSVCLLLLLLLLCCVWQIPN